MKKGILLSVLVFVFHVFVSAQAEKYLPYYHLVNEAVAVSKTEDKQKALKIYKSAFDKVSQPFPKDYVDAAALACGIDSLDRAYDFLAKALQAGYPFRKLKKVEELKRLRSEKHWQKLKSEYKEWLSVHLNSLNKELIEEIKKMYSLDQKYRGASYRKNIDKVKRIDSLNIARIMEMEKEFGKIPGIRELGYEQYGNLIIIFRHVKEDFVLNVLGTKLLKQSEQGDFTPKDVAGIIDYKAIMKVSSRKYYMTYQKYGSQQMKLKDRLVLIPVKNKSNIDSLRHTIGLPPIDWSMYDEAYVREKTNGMFEF